MANENRTSSGEMTLWQKMDLIRALSMYPALTLMVFTRRKLGYRILNTNAVIIMTIIMLIVAALFSAQGTSGTLLTLYALAMLGMTIFQRTMRWRELCQGVRWHTYSTGISYLEQVPWPPALRFLLNYCLIYRFLEPIAACLVGFILLAISRPLGVWVIFASLALRVFEENMFEKRLANDLDILDGLIASEVQGEAVKFYEGPQPEDKRRSLEDTAGIPTGVAPDIHRQVTVRKAKQALAPDNLAPEPPAAAG